MKLVRTRFLALQKVLQDFVVEELRISDAAEGRRLRATAGEEAMRQIAHKLLVFVRNPG